MGDLDLATAPEFDEAVEPYADRRFVIDLTAATFLDSTGLRALLDLATPAGSPTPLICPPGAPRRVLELTGIDQLFEMHDRLPASLGGEAAA